MKMFAGLMLFYNPGECENNTRLFYGMANSKTEFVGAMSEKADNSGYVMNNIVVEISDDMIRKYAINHLGMKGA